MDMSRPLGTGDLGVNLCLYGSHGTGNLPCFRASFSKCRKSAYIRDFTITGHCSNERGGGNVSIPYDNMILKLMFSVGSAAFVNGRGRVCTG